MSVTTMAAPGLGTEMIPSSIASTEPPLVECQLPPPTSVLEAPVTATEAAVAPIPLETATKP